MAVTVLKRKEKRNKIRAKQRLVAIREVKQIVYVKSPFKGESGIILEDK